MSDMSTNRNRPLVLVAEDDDSNFKLIKAIIGKRCDILWAKNGEDIIKLYEENKDKAKAILMDIKMPKMTGVEATEILRNEGVIIPIVMQTAYAFNTDREQAMAAGATDVLVKPITLNILRKRLSELIPGLVW
jgi:CheY-like chemotaxis protein